ncbi:MAG: hypothetical protein Aurels2KO_06480 [Aureliella sp.]
MRVQKYAVLMIGISIAFAIAIIVGDRVTEGMAINSKLTHLLIAAWMVPFTLLSVKGCKSCC